MMKQTGHKHPLTQMITEINSIFSEIGFTFAEGPEAETEHYNFDMLNVAKDHPSRDMQDTFWFKSKDVSEPTVLRTHTSPVQARFMEANKDDMPINGRPTLYIFIIRLIFEGLLNNGNL